MFRPAHAVRSGLVIFALITLVASPTWGDDKKSEPTDASEAAAKKAKQAADLNQKFATWKATRSPGQQAWETVLEENLAGFYLPRYQQAKLAGKTTAWDYVPDDPKLPRVILVGDSVSRGYTVATRKALAGKANVHRAPANCGPTATALKQLDAWLGKGDWDVFHFNFGIHDRRTPAADYESRLETIVERMQKTGATLIWASTTPIPADWKEGPTMKTAIEKKNVIAARVMKKHGVDIDDLFTLITPKLAETQHPKDVHFNEQGYTLLGTQVAKSISETLKQSDSK